MTCQSHLFLLALILVPVVCGLFYLLSWCSMPLNFVSVFINYTWHHNSNSKERISPMELRPMYLGIKLSKEENKAIIALARSEGLPKSLYARRILRSQLIAQGAITIRNPAPGNEEQVAQ
jgi:hypothetical protein